MVNLSIMKITYNLKTRLMSRKRDIKKCSIRSIKDWLTLHFCNKQWRKLIKVPKLLLNQPLLKFLQQVQKHQMRWQKQMRSAMNLDSWIFRANMEDNISKRLEIIKEDWDGAPQILLIIKLRDILMATQISSTHLEEREKDQELKHTIISLTSVSRRAEMSLFHLGTCSLLVVIPPILMLKPLASVEVFCTSVILTLQTLVQSLILSIKWDNGRHLKRRQVPKFILPVLLEQWVLSQKT